MALTWLLTIATAFIRTLLSLVQASPWKPVSATPKGGFPRVIPKDQPKFPPTSGTFFASFLREVENEVRAPLPGQITGRIPNWLGGSLIINGPGKYTFGSEQVHHVFDGAALLQKFQFKEGQVSYQCRFVESETYKKNTQAQRIVVSELGTLAMPDPCQSILGRFATYLQPPDLTDNTLVAIYPMNDAIYTYTETPLIHRIDESSLDVLNTVNIKKSIKKHIVHFSAHPYVLEDGTIYNIGLIPGSNGPEYSIIKFPSPKGKGLSEEDYFKEGRVVGTVPASWKFYPSYMHSFGLSDNYAVIIEQPMAFSFKNIATSRALKKALSSAFVWSDNDVKFHVVSLRTGENVATYLADPFFYFHVGNTYEEDGHLVLDLCAFKDAQVFDALYIQSLYDSLENGSPKATPIPDGRILRFVLPLTPSTQVDGELIQLKNTSATAARTDSGNIRLRPETIFNQTCEFPKINHVRYTGKKHRYLYCSTSSQDLADAIVKVDMETKTPLVWSEKGATPNEPIFVPTPNAQGEDDGVLLVTLTWVDESIPDFENKSTMVVLDARTMSELGRADFLSPSHVPRSFHGWYF